MKIVGGGGATSHPRVTEVGLLIFISPLRGHSQGCLATWPLARGLDAHAWQTHPYLKIQENVCDSGGSTQIVIAKNSTYSLDKPSMGHFDVSILFHIEILVRTPTIGDPPILWVEKI